MDSEKPGREYFVNLHGPYDLAYIVCHGREYTFDRGGRLLWLLEEGARIERSLNNRFVVKSELGVDNIYRNSKIMSARESARFVSRTRDDMAEMLAAFGADPGLAMVSSVSRDPAAVGAFLQEIVGHDYSRLVRDETVFNTIYSPIEIVPNDLPHPLVVQLTRGCVYNRCTFCNLYKDKVFRIKSLAELERHIAGIKSLLGGSRVNKKTLFLSDANPLMIEQDLLRSMFDLINSEFRFKGAAGAPQPSDEQIDRLEGVYSFVDALYGRQKTVDDFRQLRERHLKKIYLGLESGSDRVLAFIKKCNRAADIVALTRKIKEAGLAVGIMIIAGLGGDRYYDEHIKETVKVINRLDLEMLDSINISHLALYDHAPYKREAAKQEVRTLSYKEENRQIEEIMRGLKFSSFRPHVVGYEIKEVRF